MSQPAVSVPSAAKFGTQINGLEQSLKKLGLLAEREKYPEYSRCTASMFRGLPHFEVWKLCMDNRFYDIRLSDGSLLQFRTQSAATGEFSYAYFQNPFTVDFIGRRQFESSSRASLGDLDDSTLDQLYEVYKNGLLLRPAAVSIRYDWSPNAYQSGIHPASHVHVGLGNSMRIGTRRILLPVSFVFLILRQCYPVYWHRIRGMPGVPDVAKNIRSGLTLVDSRYWSSNDDLEMWLE